ncbi:hypothetical protein BU17DRAFT_94523 [Hysterangium stoloniferum]|nr:hypothetical protein BU17DRAFT_94523 [Hysterangium stoloniferum]
MYLKQTIKHFFDLYNVAAYQEEEVEMAHPAVAFPCFYAVQAIKMRQTPSPQASPLLQLDSNCTDSNPQGSHNFLQQIAFELQLGNHPFLLVPTVMKYHGYEPSKEPGLPYYYQIIPSRHAVFFKVASLCAKNKLTSADFANVVEQQGNTYNDPDFRIKELSPGTTPTVDIIAIHGFDGHHEKSWTADNGKFWLRDVLPQAIPTVHIL